QHTVVRSAANGRPVPRQRAVVERAAVRPAATSVPRVRVVRSIPDEPAVVERSIKRSPTVRISDIAYDQAIGHHRSVFPPYPTPASVEIVSGIKRCSIGQDEPRQADSVSQICATDRIRGGGRLVALNHRTSGPLTLRTVSGLSTTTRFVIVPYTARPPVW